MFLFFFSLNDSFSGLFLFENSRWHLQEAFYFIIRRTRLKTPQKTSSSFSNVFFPSPILRPRDRKILPFSALTFIRCVWFFFFFSLADYFVAESSLHPFRIPCSSFHTHTHALRARCGLVGAFVAAAVAAAGHRHQPEVRLHVANFEPVSLTD